MTRDLTERIDKLIVGSSPIRGLAKSIDRLLISLFAESPLRPLKLFANGTWLEHPLHPLLTDVPVGAWTVAILLDLVALLFKVPNLGMANGIIIGFGVLVALAAIATGLMDWMDVDPPELSIGMTHAILNSVATLLFAVSFFWRWSDNWSITLDKFILTLIAYGVIASGAYLGGILVYRMGTMINRNAYRSGPPDATPAMSIADLPENQLKRVDVKGNPVLLLRRGDTIYSIGAVCSHYGGPLDEGKVVDGTVQCPWHYSRFALADGSVKEGPATCPLPAYEAVVKNGQIWIKSRTQAA